MVLRMGSTELNYDAIVVGAGPAGSTAARILAERDVSVLLIDKKPQIGVPVHCGEYIPTASEMKRLAPKSRDIESLFDIPNKAVANKTRIVRFIYPNNVELEVKFEGIVLNREIFDKLLACRAAKAGADIMTATRVKGLLEGNKGVVLKSGSKLLKVKSKIVIGADGFPSSIALFSGLAQKPDPIDFGIGLQYEMVEVEVDEESIEMYFGRKYAPGAYAWIIPKGDMVANVGIGVRIPYMMKNVTIRDHFEKFVKHHPIASKKLRRAKPVSVKPGIVPVGPIRRTFANNLLLVGSAANQVIATVGAGIPPAMICGRIAGETASEYLKGECTLSDYEQRWKNEVGDMLENALQLRKIGDFFFTSDKLTDFIARKGWLNEENLRKFIYCKVDNSILTIGKFISLMARKLTH